MAIDLRKEIKKILTENGWPVLLQRTHRQMRCRCFNSVTQEADSKCPYCLGKGWVSTIERHLTRSDGATQIVSNPNLQETTPQGKVWITALNFYFMYNVAPKVGDMIYEVGWMGLKPTNLIAVYEINNILPHRGDRGRIEYYEAATKAVTLDKDFLHFSIRRIGTKTNYEVG